MKFDKELKKIGHDREYYKIGAVIPDNQLYKFWQYKNLEAANNAGFDECFCLIVSYGKHGLTVRQKESKNSFILVPKETEEFL